MTGRGKIASLPLCSQPLLPHFVHSARLFSSLLGAALLAPFAQALTQVAPGPLDNAAVLPAGTLRFGIAPRWTAADRRFGSPVDGGSTSQDLAAFLSADSLGVREAPSLTPFEDRIRAVSAVPAFRLSLGTTRVRAQSRSTSVPLTIEYGLGRRFALMVSVPIVRSVTNLVADGNVNDSTANAGISPRVYNEAEASRLTTLASQFSSALSQLRSRYPACFGASPGAGCPAIAQLDASARSYAGLVAGTYGAVALVPLAGSAAHDSVLARLISFNDQFRAALGLAPTINPIGIRPLGALPIANADLQRLVTDTTFGITADSLGPVQRVSLGAVEVGLTVGLLDHWNALAGPKIRASATALYRAATGKPGRPSVFLDAATGDGQADIEGRFAFDARVARRVVASAWASYTLQMSDEIDMRVAQAGVRLLPVSQRSTVTRNLGDQVGIDGRASYFLNGYLAGIAMYGFSRRGSDVYTPDLATGGLQAFSSPAQSVQSLGIGLTYSTLDAFSRGRGRVPMEVAWLHRQAFAGSGGAPRTFSDAVELRFYAGGSRRRASR